MGPKTLHTVLLSRASTRSSWQGRPPADDCFLHRLNQPRVRQPRRCFGHPDSVNFTDVQEDKTDIFDLDKSINSALQWEKVRNFLNDRGGVMSVTKARADKLVKEESFTCVDVRTQKGFSEGTRVFDSVNVPLFK